MKTWQAAILGLGVILLGLVLYVFLQVRALEVEQISPDLWVLRGLGGNSAVLRTDAGNVIVDTMTLPMQGARIRREARALTGMDTVLLINTHYHLDHTHGNPAFEAGTRVVSTERTLAHLRTRDADFWSGDASELLPNETLTDRDTLNIGGKTLDLVHPGHGHTDGDLVVVFNDEAAIHMGDLLFNGYYPNIDLEAGGSVQAWPQTLDALAGLDFDRVIPGHGPTTDRSGIARFRSFLVELGALARQAARSGVSLDDFLSADALTLDQGFREIRFVHVPLGLNRSFVMRRAWEEATGEIVPPPE